MATPNIFPHIQHADIRTKDTMSYSNAKGGWEVRWRDSTGHQRSRRFKSEATAMHHTAGRIHGHHSEHSRAVNQAPARDDQIENSGADQTGAYRSGFTPDSDAQQAGQQMKKRVPSIYRYMNQPKGWPRHARG
jgi:hypothetical protein